MKRFFLFLFSFIFLFSGIATAALYEGTWNSDDDYPLIEQTWIAYLDEESGTTATLNGRISDFDIFSITNFVATGVLYDSGVIPESGGWKSDFIVGYEGGQYVGFFGDGLDFGDGLPYSATLGGTVAYTVHNDGTFVTSVDNISGELSGIVNEDPSFMISWRGTAVVTGINASSLSGDMSYTEFELSQVPIPAAVWLFGSSLIGLVGIRRRLNK